jgi:hypothetical protein
MQRYHYLVNTNMEILYFYVSIICRHVILAQSLVVYSEVYLTLKLLYIRTLYIKLFHQVAQ